MELKKNYMFHIKIINFDIVKSNKILFPLINVRNWFKFDASIFNSV